MKSRTFTKKVMALNMLAGWGLVYFAVYRGAGEGVLTPIVGLLGFLFAAYTGVGAIDYKTFTDGQKKTGESE